MSVLLLPAPICDTPQQVVAAAIVAAAAAATLQQLPVALHKESHTHTYRDRDCRGAGIMSLLLI